MNSKIIVLEGLSGCGKSTIGQILAHRLSGIYIQTPESVFKQARKKADTSSIEARFLFYLSTTLIASEKIKRLKEKYKYIIVDRYIGSTIAYHAVSGVSKELIDTYKILSIEKPDKTIFIKVPLETRKERMLSRDKKMTVSDLWEIEMDFDNAVVEKMKEFIDVTITNVGSIDQIVTKIIDLIK